ncbi:MAG: patatin-like phospholipase family protein, partial [Deltaproteobacteria bacterium]|nr:patatin-like phospholipase family protein [Deltaproteobacteria bacterium]
MQVQRLLVIGLLLLLSACGPMAVGVPGPEEPRPVLLERKTPRVGLVLGGGAARGFAHVGVIRVLEREKIPFDVIVGTSVGSLVGAIYADKKSSFELEWIAFLLGEKDLFDYTFTQLNQGLVRGDRLEEFVQRRLAAREIPELKVPFAAVA